MSAPRVWSAPQRKVHGQRDSEHYEDREWQEDADGLGAPLMPDGIQKEEYEEDNEDRGVDA
jgi:hypothetical protein